MVSCRVAGSVVVVLVAGALLALRARVALQIQPVAVPVPGVLLAGHPLLAGSNGLREAADDAARAYRRGAQRAFAAIGPVPTVLVMMVDSRPLSLASYVGAAAVCNDGFARARGYDFTVFRPAPLTHADVLRRFSDASPPPPPASPDVKDAATVYHPLLRRYRAASWAKLLPAWRAAAAASHDVVIYVDSDACLASARHNWSSFAEAAARVPPLPAAEHPYGVPLAQASILFYGNVGYGWPNHPMAGFFAFVPGPSTARFFRDWWDVHDGRFGFEHAYEQIGLWALMEHGYANATMCVVNSGQMVDDDPTGFLKHWGSDQADRRERHLEALARALPGMSAPAAMEARLADIVARRSAILDGLEVAAQLAAAPKGGGGGGAPFAATAFMPAAW